MPSKKRRILDPSPPAPKELTAEDHFKALKDEANSLLQQYYYAKQEVVNFMKRCPGFLMVDFTVGDF